MRYPRKVLKTVRESATRHDNVEDACKDAQKRLCRMKEWDGFVATLIRHAIQELVYDARHVANIKTRQWVRDHAGPALVKAGTSPTVQQLAEGLYLYRIAGTALGRLTGEQLPQIAAAEREKASGHEFNARLCESLSPLIPKAKTVAEAISKRKLVVVWRNTQDGLERDAA